MRNPTLETNLDRLSRYGYQREPSASPVAAQADWARLKGDFAEAGGRAVPDLDDLPPDTRAAAQRYIDLKNEADRLLSACESAHREILDRGIDVARVEGYAVIRDEYEDKVEEFGAARADVSRLLSQS